MASKSLWWLGGLHASCLREREIIADITQSFKHYELSRSWVLYHGIFKYYGLNCGLDLFF